MTTQNKTVGIMLDIETLGLGADAVVMEVALLPFDLKTGVALSDGTREYLPIDPQIEAGSLIEARTLVWWLGQDPTLLKRLAANIEGDFGMLKAIIRNLAYLISHWRVGDDEGFELWAKGPQFDVVLLQRLLDRCGITTPWKYYEVRDLRTIMALTAVYTDSIEPAKDYIAHSALSDCRHQVELYALSMERIQIIGDNPSEVPDAKNKDFAIAR